MTKTSLERSLNKGELNPLSNLGEIQKVSLSSIRYNPYQPRTQFAQEELQELADSIRTLGIIHPPIVRPLSSGLFELIAGERRLRAAALAGLQEINVLVRSASDQFSLEAALIENIQRANLNPLEIAKALKKMGETYGLDQEQLAKKVGKKRSTVANYLRLLQLSPPLQLAVETLQISMGHAKVILSCPQEKQMGLLEIILKEHLTVRQTELMLLKLTRKKKSTPPPEKDIYLAQLERQLQQLLGTKVSFDGNAQVGKLTIDYFSLSDLNRILSLLKIAINE